MMDARDTEISEQERAIVKASLGPIMAALAGQSENGVVTASMVSRVLAFALATVIESDDDLSTPREFRQAGDYIGKLVAHHVRQLREEADNTGTSFMADVVSGRTRRD
ncbi:hypothetical protein [Sphingobium phenoxybenzoativorans]|uniref:hypothetical protein n=1 Tax=Sphingobium phenoxybenzoativorans TaxID=1592790 RepID=UPI0008721185|nr:hypothetical protein [Sphingobium phenoxybenzoativorans]